MNQGKARNENADQVRRNVERRFIAADPDHPAVNAMMELSEAVAARALQNGEKLPEPPSVSRSKEAPPGPDEPLDPIEFLRREIDLPSLPQVFEELNTALNDEETSAKDIADIISRDTSLSGQLLRLVNSAFYSFPSQIDTITRAVAIAGRKQIAALALGASVMSMFPDVPGEYMDMRSFWRHSVAVGVLARGLSEQSGYDEPERMFVAGMLHDVGRLALARSSPDKAVAAIEATRGGGLMLFEGERAVLGFDHARLGGIMLRKWNLPYSLVNAVLHHHDPETAKAVLEPSLVHTADVLACALMFGPYGEPLVPPLEETAWNALGLGPGDLKKVSGRSLLAIEETWQALKSS
jgi:putative nucleotidyltransferase with HDIG domain